MKSTERKRKVSSVNSFPIMKINQIIGTEEEGDIKEDPSLDKKEIPKMKNLPSKN